MANVGAVDRRQYATADLPIDGPGRFVTREHSRPQQFSNPFGAPSRALDALDAIGEPERAAAWVRGEVAAGRRIMGFGHAVYRAPDPRSAMLRTVAGELGGALVERAIAIETEILTTLAEIKPDRPLPSNVEFYAGVIMETVGLPRSMFTPSFAVSRVIGWATHALEQAEEAKMIRPSSRYTGPTLTVLPASVVM